MKKLLLLPLLLLTGCGVWNKIDPNLATRLVKTHPRMQAVCDYAGGCQNVEVGCDKYDGTGNDPYLQNKTFVRISTGQTDDNTWIEGISMQDNAGLNMHQAVEDAISSYWAAWGAWKTNTERRWVPQVDPNLTSCEKDCTQ